MQSLIASFAPELLDKRSTLIGACIESITCSADFSQPGKQVYPMINCKTSHDTPSLGGEGYRGKNQAQLNAFRAREADSHIKSSGRL